MKAHIYANVPDTGLLIVRAVVTKAHSKSIDVVGDKHFSNLAANVAGYSKLVSADDDRTLATYVSYGAF
jgi:hypothetical protein